MEALHIRLSPSLWWLGQLLWRLLTSVGPSKHLSTFLAQRQTDRSPRVIHATFLPYTRRIYSSTLPDDYRALKIMAFSPGWNCLVCDFCSSGRKFACGFLQIPPHSGHPCRSASGSRHQGPQRTFTSKSPISHHSRSDGACAPRAMPGALRKGHQGSNLGDRDNFTLTSRLLISLKPDSV